MAIIASSNSTKRELIPAGNYIARCYQMIYLGEVMENYMGEGKLLKKVRIGWELPTELKVFKEENGEQPRVISKEYTLSTHEKATLRKVLASWRGKDFTESEAKAFDISVLVGKPCMLNIIHKHGVADPSKIYEEIGSISPMPRGMICPEQINPSFIVDYDNFDEERFNSLPDFIKDKMKTSLEYAKMKQPAQTHLQTAEDLNSEDADNDLPF